MKERPILFQAAMVRALLAGTKTQTRRAVKDQSGLLPFPPTLRVDESQRLAACWGTRVLACPFGQPGDRLWVREAWKPVHSGDPSRGAKYRADLTGHDGTKWKPGIHMFRWASRILLEVTGIRVERLQAISEAEAIAEGLSQGAGCWWNAGDEHMASPTPKGAYALLWSAINGAGSWDANPWVWVVEFRRVQP